MSELLTAADAGGDFPNPNRCAECLRKDDRAVPASQLAGQDVCGECQYVGDVFDVDLIQSYRDQGLDDAAICRHHPKLRVRVGAPTKRPAERMLDA